jgi:signal transduction histidine kinase
MKGLIVGLLVLCFTSAFSQKFNLAHIDSLQKELGGLKPGHRKVFVEQQLFFYYLNSNSKKALDLAMTSLAEAKQRNDDSSVCVFYNCMGEAYFYLDDFKNALDNYNKNYKLAEKMGYKQEMALALNDMSGVYQNQSDDITAQSCSFKALSIYETLKDNRMIAMCNLNIGVTYNNQNNSKKAIFFGQRAIDFTLKTKAKDILPTAYELMATAYAGIKDVNQAKAYDGKALEIFQKNKNDYGVATVLSLLAELESGDFAARLKLGIQAQQLWDKIAPDNFYSINNLGNLGSVYGQMAIREKEPAKRKALFNQSQTYLQQAINLAKKTNVKSSVIDYSDSLSMVNAAVGNYKDAYAELKLSSTLYDSVYSQDNKNKLAAVESKRDIELRDKQLQINKLEIADRKRQAWLLAGGIVLLIVVALLLIRQNRIRQKANIQLDESNRVKTKFFGILNHDLRSPVTNFLHLLYMKENEPELLNEKNAAAYEKKIKASAEDLLATMEDLLLWSKGQMENFKPQVEEVMVAGLYDYLAQQFSQDKVSITFESPEGMMIKTDEHYLKTIMQNLTNNAVKALVQIPNPAINWRAWEDKGWKYLAIKDNGPGATAQQLQPLYDESAPIGIRKGLGLHIVRDMAKAINCTVTTQLNAGEGVEIRLGFKGNPGLLV